MARHGTLDVKHWNEHAIPGAGDVVFCGRLSFIRVPGAKCLLSLFIVSLLFISCVFAEEVSFEATVDSTKIPMGAAGQLSLTVHGTQDVDKIELPEIEGFDVRYVGPSKQVRVVNFEYSTSKTFIYMLLPQKEGVFTVPSVKVDIAGKTYRSQPISLLVLPPSPDGGAPADPLTDPQALADRLRVIMVTSKTKCYVSEELPLMIRLYSRGFSLEDISFPDIKQNGFILYEYSKPRQYEENIDGQKFQVIEFITWVTPLRTGTMEVGPAVITANIVYRSNVQKNPFGNSAFNDDFLATFFGGFQKKSVTLTSYPITLEALDLPSEGIPADFSGAVGQFTFDAAVSPAEVKLGDPLTLRLVVTGFGNLKSIKMPTVKDPQFKVYEPRIKEQDTQKTLEQVIVPAKEDIKEVPALSFSYFDTESGKYQTITRGPFPVTVKPLEKGQEFQAVRFADKPVSMVQESFGRDIVFIKDRSGALQRKGDLFLSNLFFYTILIIFLNVWGALVGLFFHRQRVLSDPSAVRRAAAYNEARRAWKDAGQLLIYGHEKKFYAALSSLLREYCAAKLQLPSSDVDAAGLEKALMDERISQNSLWKLRNVFQTEEKAHFAGLPVSEAEMKRDYLDTEEIIESIERQVR